MTNNDWDWVDKEEDRKKDERANGYFSIVEGTNEFFLLSHIRPLAQVYEGNKYRVAEDGEDPKKIKIRGVCWVLQDGLIKQAKLPYSVVKLLRAIQLDTEWSFELPFPHKLTLTAKNARTTQVEYALNPSPKRSAIPEAIMTELQKKPTPEEIIETIKKRQVSPRNSTEDTRSASAPDYPSEDIDPKDIPF